MKRSMIIVAAICTMAAGTVSAQDGKALYESKCKSCHGVDGKGDTVMGKKKACKDYTDAKVQDALKDDVAFKSLKEGLKKGDNTLMQPVKDVTDDQIKGLIKYMRTFKK